MTQSLLFFNRCFDKKRLKYFILWFFNKYGTQETIQLVENLKKIGFQYATEAGISIGIDDLKIPRIKPRAITFAEKKVQAIEFNYLKGNVTEIERRQQSIEEWNLISETLKNNVIQFFKTTDIFNPIYMIAFSGARGNISQVRQLIGMRGLMVDPQGKILDFPIRSNFREGLNLTEYIISCYGARKGVVDTALRTATSGYLTRRLVDVAQQVIIGQQDCRTTRGIYFQNLLDGSKNLFPLQDRLVGRILLKDVFTVSALTKKKYRVGIKNQEISSRLSLKLSQLKNPVFLRSPLTCRSKNAVCQMCYGWSLANSMIVSIGEAVGVLAAQSIGEPGTQLTMRTFHTGGIFTGGFIDQICAPFNGTVEYLEPFQGLLVRTLNGQIGFLTKTEGKVKVERKESPRLQSTRKIHELSLTAQYQSSLVNKKVNNFLSKMENLELKFQNNSKFSTSYLIFNIPLFATLLIRNYSFVLQKDVIAELPSTSFLDNQRQATEQGIFSPISGQIYFDDLVLIEKITRDGNVHRTTHGLGLIWVISGVVWKNVFGQDNFPWHGDLVEWSSTRQKFQILIDKPYILDLNLSHSIQKLKLLKDSSFSHSSKLIESKLDPLDTFFSKNNFFYLNFQKINYRNFQYFTILNLKIKFLKTEKFNFIPLLSDRSEFIRKTNCCQNQNTQKIGLNFSFNKQLSPIYAKKIQAEFNFSLFSSYPLSTTMSGKFLLNLRAHYKNQSKLGRTVLFRKDSSYLKIEQNNFWINFIEPIKNLTEKINFWKLYHWHFYLKQNETRLNHFEVSLKNRKKISLKTSIPHLRKLKAVAEYDFLENKILKFFVNYNKSFTQTITISSSNLKMSRLYLRMNWIAHFQSFLLQFNRQGSLKFYLLNYWSITQKFPSPYLNPNNQFFTKITTTSLKDWQKKLNWNIQSDMPVKRDQTKKNQKPFLFNRKKITQLLLNQNPVIYYIIHKVYKSIYKKNQTDFDLKFFKIGFKAQFKLNIIPSLQAINYQNNSKKIKHINQEFLFQKIVAYLHTPKRKKLKILKTQIFLSWPYLTKNLHLSSTFGFILNRGSIGINNIVFDNHDIIIDILAVKHFLLLKNTLKSQPRYKHIINQQNRFFFVPNKIKKLKLILFQLIEKNNNQKDLFWERQLVDQSSSNREIFSLLIFNSLRYYSNFFKRKSLKPKNFSENFSLFRQVKPLPNRIFYKVSLISRIQLKTKIVSNSYFFMASYTPIYKHAFEGFNLEGFNLKEFMVNASTIPKKLDSKYFYLLVNFSSKRLNFSLIKRLDFQTLDLKRLKKLKTFKIFHAMYEAPSSMDVIIIKTFINLPNGEMVSIKTKNQKTDSIALTRFDIESITLDDSLSKYQKLNHFRLGNFIRFGDILKNKKMVTESGQVIYRDKNKFIIRKAIPFLITPSSLVSIYQNEIIKKNTRLFTLCYYQIKTGDIIQGIPKIEELFEARSTREGVPLLRNVHTQLKQLFNQYSKNISLFEATQKSFEIIQQVIVDEIQKIYCSQGVQIADKHLEIIVRQMTSKVQILEGGQTGLLAGELIEFDWIRLLHQRLINEEIFYEPIILGITKSSLETESFISAASFQETTRILSKAAIQNKVDFVRGLKQNVILGNLVPAGTGFLPFN